MGVEKILKCRNVRLCLFLGAWWDWMTWHRNGKRYSLGILRASLAWFYAYDVRFIRTTPGEIFFKRSAAASALGLPPLRQSSNSNKGCRTGFEKDTLPESTSVIFRIPQPCLLS